MNYIYQMIILSLCFITNTYAAQQKQVEKHADKELYSTIRSQIASAGWQLPEKVITDERITNAFKCVTDFLTVRNQVEDAQYRQAKQKCMSEMATIFPSHEITKDPKKVDEFYEHVLQIIEAILIQESHVFDGEEDIIFDENFEKPIGKKSDSQQNSDSDEDDCPVN